MKICIVGGGSAGWMAATTFNSLLDCEKITLIESPTTAKSGVGESTLQSIIKWINLVDIDVEEILRETGGSLKHSIKFTNFLNKNSGSFHYPFGNVPTMDPQVAWGCIMDGMFSHNKYAEYINPIASLAEKGKIDVTSFKSLHFDAIKFANYLKENHCEEVEHVSADVINFEESEKGIESLELDNGSTITADLFVDCTGFSSLLLGEYFKEPFISFNNILPNDSAWATQVPYTDKEKELVPYTECTAIDNGWVWNIPLWERIGTGYVYSSKHVGDEDAKQEFIKHLKSKNYDVSGCKFKKIPMRIGRHERSFVKNVVAIGLSAGFIEPLESNGLFTVHENLIDLWKILRRGLPSGYMKNVYNSVTSCKFDEFAEFVAVHYAFTQRDDTEYWRDNMNRDYDITGDKNYDKYGMLAFSREILLYSNFPHSDRGFHYVASGMNVCPYTSIENDANEVSKCMIQKHKWDTDFIEKLPTAYEFLKENIHTSLDK